MPEKSLPLSLELFYLEVFLVTVPLADIAYYLSRPIFIDKISSTGRSTEHSLHHSAVSHFGPVAMPVPELPLELLIMIAHNLTNDRGERCFADFNAFLQVNHTLYSCLNPTLWRSAVECSATTARALTHLIHSNNLASLKHFLERGADIETALPDFKPFPRGLKEPTPLVAAACLDNVPVARLLLENGAKAHHDEPGYYSALHAAHSAEMVHLLLDHHADPERQDRHRRRPLHCYAMRDNIAAMRAVLQHGVEVDPLGQLGRTPIQEARSVEGLTLLLNFGADVQNLFWPTHVSG